LQKKDKHTAARIHVRGLVQGVGFRPFIYHIALKYHLNGWVENRNDGVTIQAEGSEEDVSRFIAAVRQEAPEAAQVRQMDYTPSDWLGHPDFSIRKSLDIPGEITEISPDIAVCHECLMDMKRQPHRKDFAFINCTNCGPRFTIISDLPYDREKTTMQVFPMCPKCRAEYTDLLDRRFHAQPLACNDCGPHYSMSAEMDIIEDIGGIITRACSELEAGKIVAIKGLGGFNLACDAFNENAARELRARKNRDGKPFAVMFGEIGSLQQYLEVTDTEREALISWRRPIVILKNKPGADKLASAVSNGFNTTGAMLPYVPFHYMLFEKLKTPAIVMTSGNISEEPILIDNSLASDKLAKVYDCLITYNREIRNRTDDSVMMAVNDRPRMIRRSRGFVPSPVELTLEAEGIFAAGAELVNCFCIGKGRQALMSQHIGDLKNLETLEFYEESVNRFKKMFRFEPKYFAIDLHPDYLSSRYGLEQARSHAGTVVTKVQHHHAHIASCMAEHGLDETVIGISLDGVGYGTDGNTWGFEIMTCDLVDFERKYHPAYIPQPGGDLTTREPWRMALSYLFNVYGEKMTDLPFEFIKRVGQDTIRIVIESIKKNINTPLTCSAGRLFDAVAAITGACIKSDFHAEAPMRLEQMVNPAYRGRYGFTMDADEINFDDVIRGIAEDMMEGKSVDLISTHFHNTIAATLLQGCELIRDESGLQTVALSGGTFQNRYLLSHVENNLQQSGFQVFSQNSVPSNDGGIALGQLAVCAKRIQSGII
jgi:hydrogenase maturation protein HypF